LLGDLHVVQVSPPDIVAITNDASAYINGVVVSPAPPERLLFLDRFNTSTDVPTGTLMMSDLSAIHLPEQPPVTEQLANRGGISGQGVQPFSYLFGQNGNEILFIDDYSAQTATGTLVWTNGNGTFQVIGEGATPGAWTLSADRSHAVAAINVGSTAATDGGMVDPDMGNLVWIDLFDGSSTLIASSVTALPHEHYCPATLCDPSGAQGGCEEGCTCISNIPDGGNVGGGSDSYCSCAVPPSCSYLNQSLELMFSVSADGTSVAYESPLGGQSSVFVATVGAAGVQKNLIGNGQFPALARDGQLVAYYDPGADGGTSLLEVRDTMANLVVASPAVGAAPPRFSPDGTIVAFPESYRIQGEALSGEIADVWLLQTMAGAVSLPYAMNAAWNSLTFWPATGETEQVSLLANLADPTGVATLTNGTGDLQVDGPPVLFTGGAIPGPPLASNVGPQDFGLLPATGGFALRDNGSLGRWLPSSMNERRPGALSPLGQTVFPSTLLTSATVPGLDSDEIAFLTARSTAACDVLCPAPGPLWGGLTGPMEHLKDNVASVALTPDGRVLAIVQDGTSASGLWLLPLNGSN
jgi:hypothetical protein